MKTVGNLDGKLKKVPRSEEICYFVEQMGVITQLWLAQLPHCTDSPKLSPTICERSYLRQTLD